MKQLPNKTIKYTLTEIADADDEFEREKNRTLVAIDRLRRIVLRWRVATEFRGCLPMYEEATFRMASIRERIAGSE